MKRSKLELLQRVCESLVGEERLAKGCLSNPMGGGSWRGNEGWRKKWRGKAAKGGGA